MVNDASGLDVKIGWTASGWNRYFPGMVGMIIIYNRDLSDDEISDLYQNPQSPPMTGVIAWWNFDEGSGDIAYDKSGNGNHGTIHNAVWVSEQGQVSPLLNINITNSQVTLDVNITNSVLNIQGDVNITNAELNIKITSQDVDLTIINPSGIPIYTGKPVQVTEYHINFGLDEGQSDTIVNETGRGRLLSVSIYAYKVSGTSSAQPTALKLRITVDGVVNEFSINELGIMAGTPTTPMGAGVTDAWVRSYKLSNLGGISAIHVDSGGYIDRVFAVFLLEFDYASSLTVEIVNPSGSGGYFSGDAFAWVGGYP